MLFWNNTAFVASCVLDYFPDLFIFVSPYILFYMAKMFLINSQLNRAKGFSKDLDFNNKCKLIESYDDIL